MPDSKQNGYLISNTLVFAHNLCRAIEDMGGMAFEFCPKSFFERPFSTAKRMIAFIEFAGAIQGHYIVALDEALAGLAAYLPLVLVESLDVYPARASRVRLPIPTFGSSWSGSAFGRATGRRSGTTRVRSPRPHWRRSR